MKTRHHKLATLVAVFAVAITGIAVADGLSRQEEKRINVILAYLEEMKDSQFIRNGKSYDSSTAVAFLRKKWSAHRAAVTNAETFVSEIATKSATTGEPYKLRLPDGSETNCAALLSKVLAITKMNQPEQPPP
ncbi:MAG: DUF5329 family protein [bacterium]